MEKESRKMLKFMLENSLCKDGSCLFSDFYEAYCKATGYPEQRVMACMRYLESKGFIKYGKNQNGRNVGFELEHKAYHYEYFSTHKKMDFIIKSVVVPIAVTIPAAFLTAWLTVLLAK